MARHLACSRASNQMPEPESVSRRSHVLVFIFFAVITLIATWPVVARLGSHLAGGRDDLWVHQWTFWWIREALRQGTSPFFTSNLYSPTGVPLTSHNIAWFNIALWLPLQALFDRIIAYNLVFLGIIALNGFCMYLFAWEHLRSQAAAVVSGLIFGFWPYTLSHYDHANMMVVFWVPLTLLLLHKLIIGRNNDQHKEVGRNWPLIVAASFSLAMIGISRWQLLIMSSPILIGYIFYLLWAIPSARNGCTALDLFLVSGISLTLMAPLLSPLVIDQFTREFPQDVFLDEPKWGRTDLLAYYVPSIHNGLWQARVAPIYENFTVNKYYTPYLGYTTLALAVAGTVRRWRQSWIWLILAVFYILLALGPELIFNGHAYPEIPMPYRVVEDLFFIRLIRRPDRLNIFLSLPMAMLAGFGMQTLLGTMRTGNKRRLFATAITLLLLIAYLPVPFATTQPVTPVWFSMAAREGEKFTILDLPINDRSYDKWYMQYQTDHELPLATGHVSRLPREATDYLHSVPFLAKLAERDQIPDPAISAVGQQLRLLNDAGIRYLIIHKLFANEGLQAVWRDWLVVDPAYEDNDLIVYRTELDYGRDFAFIQNLNGDIGLVRVEYAPTEGIQQGTIKVHAVWGTAESPDKDFLACLSLSGAGSATAVKQCQAPDDASPTSNWSSHDIRRASYTLPMPANLSPGKYELALGLSEPGSEIIAGNTAVLGDVTISAFDPALLSSVRWQEGISLAGSDISDNKSELNVTLYWTAEEPVAESYKVFLHLVDADTGEIVAQSDMIPRNWTYPTTAWEPGEIVHDLRSLPVDDISSGAYTLQLGLYNEQTGERLPLTSEEGVDQPDTLTLATWEP